MKLARKIAESARAAGRPVAVSLMVPKADRSRLGDAWIAVGLVAIADEGISPRPVDLDSTWTVIPVSRGATERARASVEQWRAGRRSSVHGAGNEYVLGVVVSCALAQPAHQGSLASHDHL
jgi:hypothetical protein